jgi:hypothetical protein
MGVIERHDELVEEAPHTEQIRRLPLATDHHVNRHPTSQ